jgi:hypothetical protein
VIAGALLAVFLAASPARAYWLKEDFVSGQAGHAYAGLHLLDTAVYEKHSGLGLGTDPFELQHFGWDVRRAGRPDASGHDVTTVWPVKGYVTLHSWKGDPWLFSDNDGKNTVGRVELFASYSNWSKLGSFDEVTGVDSSGKSVRGTVAGSVPARVIDAGLRWDYGKYFAASIGRYELKTRAAGSFLPRYSTQWYGALQVSLGGTFAMSDSSAGGGGLDYLALSAWAWVKHLFRCRGPFCGVTPDPDNPR